METNRPSFFRQRKGLFKSYYVVWKHAGRIIQIAIGAGFKSYYVVWKPCAATCWERIGGGLNRTM